MEPLTRMAYLANNLNNNKAALRSIQWVLFDILII